MVHHTSRLVLADSLELAIVSNQLNALCNSFTASFTLTLAQQKQNSVNINNNDLFMARLSKQKMLEAKSRTETTTTVKWRKPLETKAQAAIHLEKISQSHHINSERLRSTGDWSSCSGFGNWKVNQLTHRVHALPVLGIEGGEVVQDQVINQGEVMARKREGLSGSAARNRSRSGSGATIASSRGGATETSDGTSYSSQFAKRKATSKHRSEMGDVSRLAGHEGNRSTRARSRGLGADGYRIQTEADNPERWGNRLAQEAVIGMEEKHLPCDEQNTILTFNSLDINGIDREIRGKRLSVEETERLVTLVETLMEKSKQTEEQLKVLRKQNLELENQVLQKNEQQAFTDESLQVWLLP